MVIISGVPIFRIFTVLSLALTAMLDKKAFYQLSAVDLRVDEWMTCNFTSFSTVLQSYQDDGHVIIKGCVQWNPINN